MPRKSFVDMKKALFLFVAFTLILTIQAQTRIAVIADPHVLATSLFDNGAAFESAKNGNSRLIEYSQFLFDSAMTAVAQKQPNLLFLVGDMSNDGEKASHEHIVSKLQELQNLGIQPVVIPGNNDIANKNAYTYAGDQKTATPSITEDDYKTLYAPFGFSQAVSNEPDGLSYMLYPNNHLALLCLNSAKPNTPSVQYNEGGIYEPTLQWAEAELKKAKDTGRMVVALMHHQATNHFNMEQDMTPNYIANTTDDYPELAALQSRLLAAGVEVVFTGHYHMTSIKHTLNDGTQLYDVGTGSLSSYPSPIRWVTLANDGTMDITTQLIDTYHTLELTRNENTAKGIINRIVDTAFPEIDKLKNSKDYQGFVSMFGKNALNLPTSKDQMRADISDCMLSSMTTLVNELSRGDENTRSPQKNVDACMAGFDAYLLDTICAVCHWSGEMEVIAKPVLLKVVKEYRDMLEDMCKSVFFNYVGDDETLVVPDNTNTLQINPSTVANIINQKLDITNQKVFRDGQIYIHRNGHTFDILGKQLD